MVTVRVFSFELKVNERCLQVSFMLKVLYTYPSRARCLLHCSAEKYIVIGSADGKEGNTTVWENTLMKEKCVMTNGCFGAMNALHRATAMCLAMEERDESLTVSS